MFTSILFAPEEGSNFLDARDASRLLPFLVDLGRRPPRGDSGGAGPCVAWDDPRREPVSDEVGGRLSPGGGLRALRGRDPDGALGLWRGDRCRRLGDLLLWRGSTSACCCREGRPSRGDRDRCRRAGLGDLERPDRLLGFERRSRGTGERGRCGRGDKARSDLDDRDFGGTALSGLAGLTSCRAFFGCDS